MWLYSRTSLNPCLIFGYFLPNFAVPSAFLRIGHVKRLFAMNMLLPIVLYSHSDPRVKKVWVKRGSPVPQICKMRSGFYSVKLYHYALPGATTTSAPPLSQHVFDLEHFPKTSRHKFKTGPHGSNLILLFSVKKKQGLNLD